MSHKVRTKKRRQLRQRSPKLPNSPKPLNLGNVSPPLESVESARAAGLRYVSDQMAGIRRFRSGKGFRYRDPAGNWVHKYDDLDRIRSLAIPPAWMEVWICPIANGHLQATGRDSRGRKQYRYHPRWREVRDESKYDRMIAFGEYLPQLRRQTDLDLALPGLPREKVLATVVRLLETTLIRVGNEEYVRENHSFGLTTMRNKHAEIEGSALRFEFRGKSGVKHCVNIHNRRLARIVRRCQELPGEELFQYLDEQGNRHPIDSADVNDYLRKISGQDFTAKDFRTWAGTLLAAQALQEFEAVDSKAQVKHNIVLAIETVAKRLGNTKAICRKCYIHPAIIEGYMEGSLREMLQQKIGKELIESLDQLPPEEAVVLAFLQKRLQNETRNNGQKS